MWAGLFQAVRVVSLALWYGEWALVGMALCWLVQVVYWSFHG